MSLKQMYLIGYNVACCMGWAYVLYLTVTGLLNPSIGLPKLFSHIWSPLSIVQTLALLEIVHALIGFVRSSPFTTALQVSSRIFLVWGINAIVPDSRYFFGFPLMVISWCLVEVPRYAFYAVNLVKDDMPYWFKWIRYSLFLVLYPTGITGEVLCIIWSRDYIGKHHPLSYELPNQLNFGFDYYTFIHFILLSYIPGSYIMFFHMLAQRKKVLSGAAGAGKDKKKQ